MFPSCNKNDKKSEKVENTKGQHNIFIDEMTKIRSFS